MDKEFFCETEDDLIYWAYGGKLLSKDNVDDVKDTCLLTPLNTAALEINEKVRCSINSHHHDVHDRFWTCSQAKFTLCRGSINTRSLTATCSFLSRNTTD